MDNTSSLFSLVIRCSSIGIAILLDDLLLDSLISHYDNFLYGLINDASSLFGLITHCSSIGMVILIDYLSFNGFSPYFSHLVVSCSSNGEF